ncbi:MAG: archaetidylserine decarboxylase [Desulfobacteraceae bacterium]|jgi:phosphatidylserine decarboxylase|nr:archaetidylserine decarboxylase [Desulfobacteraceae bacterium]
MSKQLDVIEYYDRKTGELCRETVMGDAAIKWAYQAMSGKLFSHFIFGSSLLSRILGWYFDTSFSRGKIAKTIFDLKIDESEFAKPQDAFSSFNDFFIRKLKDSARPFSNDENCFLSPADGRLLVYNDIISNTRVQVKGIEDSLHNLFGRKIDDFNDGKVAVVRLCPADYHRFHFPCEGIVVDQVKVKGKYHSVNPVALDSKEKIFCLNKRSYTLIDTKKFGRVAFMEVGAFGVAGIHQTFSGTTVERMQEKGYFNFGGSTIVLVFQKNTIEFETDLLENSRKGIETLVKFGETIAHSVQES